MGLKAEVVLSMIILMLVWVMYTMHLRSEIKTLTSANANLAVSAKLSNDALTKCNSSITDLEVKGQKATEEIEKATNAARILAAKYEKNSQEILLRLAVGANGCERSEDEMSNYLEKYRGIKQ